MTNGLSVVLLLALWAVFLWNPLMRTFRSILLLLVASTIYLSAPHVAPGVAPWIQGAAAVGVALTLTLWSRPFLGLRPQELDFLAMLDRINSQLNAASQRFQEAPHTAQDWRAALESAISEISAAAPPGAEWAAARDDVLSLLRERVRLLSQPALSGQQFQQFVAHRERVHRRIALARSRSIRFWNLLE